MECLKRKIVLNKKNNQLTITIPKKALRIKKRIPQFLRIRKEDLEF